MIAEVTHECAVFSQQHQLLFIDVQGCLNKGTCRNLHPAFLMLSMDNRVASKCVKTSSLCL